MSISQNVRSRRDPDLRRPARWPALRPAASTRSASARSASPEAGAATAEYIVATMAAVGFAGLLIVILRGDEVRGILTELVRSALTVG
ncbi:DUF4244 domain-containing protein [Cryobacterium melibiosiphilum]|uniref:DUF4244 domain-containing protein n=1 Tax=Cryobacterium melibiosiphilum TaxID=995039 RepID=A0A3A5MDE8_9MICO|nr:DUF4244 domain-containing protein [Cryobacterium melibiosiphilum]RJT88150.1 DUF4244 domain-containing protein [Cryobacterium melibiosiphilum]